jgi:hypothetical protein
MYGNFVAKRSRGMSIAQGKILVEPDTQGSRFAHLHEDVLGRRLRKGVTFTRGIAKWRSKPIALAIWHKLKSTQAVQRPDAAKRHQRLAWNESTFGRLRRQVQALLL